LLDLIPLQLDREGIKERGNWREGWGGGDYSRAAIILNISIKAGRSYEGRLLLEEIQYASFLKVL